MTSIIKIKLNQNLIDNMKQLEPKDFVIALIKSVLKFINRNIGLRTNIEYRIDSVYDCVLEYKIKPYTVEQTKMDIYSLALEKFNTIINFCNNIEDKSYNNNMLWVIRSLNKLLSKNDNTKNFSVKNILYICAIIDGKTIKENELIIKHPTIIEPKYVITKFCGNSTIRQYIDPYIKNYMICADYSKNLLELGYFYNCLHVYEHYITHAWEKMDESHILDFNGSTFFNGLCYIYTVVDDEKTLKDQLISLILFQIKSSNVEYVKNSKILQLETVRTISEAYTMRNITRLGRSDQEAYNGEYPPEIFAYWSSEPMNILLVTDHEITINYNKLNDYYNKYHISAKKPPKPVFNYFPLEAHINHYITNQHTFKADTKNIIDKIYNNKCNNCFYGLDTKSVIYTNEFDVITKNKESKLIKDPMFDIQTPLSPLLFFAKVADVKQVEQYIDNNILPNESSLFESTNLNWYDKKNFLQLYDGNLNDAE